MAKGNSSAGGGSASCSTEQTGNVATLPGGFRPSTADSGEPGPITIQQPPIEDDAQAWEIVAEAILEVEAIAGQLLKSGDDVDTYLARTFGTRLHELAQIVALANDNSQESAMPWATLWARVNGIGAPARKVRHV